MHCQDHWTVNPLWHTHYFRNLHTTIVVNKLPHQIRQSILYVFVLKKWRNTEKKKWGNQQNERNCAIECSRSQISRCEPARPIMNEMYNFPIRFSCAISHIIMFGIAFFFISSVSSIQWKKKNVSIFSFSPFGWKDGNSPISNYATVSLVRCKWIAKRWLRLRISDTKLPSFCLVVQLKNHFQHQQLSFFFYSNHNLSAATAPTSKGDIQCWKKTAIMSCFCNISIIFFKWSFEWRCSMVFVGFCSPLSDCC